MKFLSLRLFLFVAILLYSSPLPAFAQSPSPNTGAPFMEPLADPTKPILENTTLQLTATNIQPGSEYRVFYDFDPQDDVDVTPIEMEGRMKGACGTLGGVGQSDCFLINPEDISSENGGFTFTINAGPATGFSDTELRQVCIGKIGTNENSCTPLTLLSERADPNLIVDPTATPIPPPEPPCADKYITRSESTSYSGSGPTPTGTFIGCGQIYTGLGINISTEPTGFISSLFTFLLSISGMLLLGLIIYSGFQFMTSQGDQEKIKVARERITSAIIGFFFLIFSMVILEVIGVDILKIPGFCRDGDISCSSVINRDSSYDNIENSRLNRPEIVVPSNTPTPRTQR